MQPETRIKILRIYLQVFGGVTLLAFAAAAMPASWMIAIANFFEILDVPDHPLTWYLARHLSALYGFCGIAVLLLARNIAQNMHLIRALGWGIMALGCMQWIIDVSAAMPASWTWGESVSTFFGGAVIVYLAAGDRQSPDSMS